MAILPARTVVAQASLKLVHRCMHRGIRPGDTLCIIGTGQTVLSKLQRVKLPSWQSMSPVSSFIRGRRVDSGRGEEKSGACGGGGRGGDDDDADRCTPLLGKMEHYPAAAEPSRLGETKTGPTSRDDDNTRLSSLVVPSGGWGAGGAAGASGAAGRVVRMKELFKSLYGGTSMDQSQVGQIRDEMAAALDAFLLDDASGDAERAGEDNGKPGIQQQQQQQQQQQPMNTSPYSGGDDSGGGAGGSGGSGGSVVRTAPNTTISVNGHGGVSHMMVSPAFEDIAHLLEAESETKMHGENGSMILGTDAEGSGGGVAGRTIVVCLLNDSSRGKAPSNLEPLLLVLLRDAACSVVILSKAECAPHVPPELAQRVCVVHGSALDDTDLKAAGILDATAAIVLADVTSQLDKSYSGDELMLDTEVGSEKRYRVNTRNDAHVVEQMNCTIQGDLF